MRVTEVAQPPGPDRIESALALASRVQAVTNVPALSDHLRLDLTGGSDTAPPLLVSVTDTSGLIGFALVSAANDGAILEVVVSPALADPLQVRDDVVETALDIHGRRSPEPVLWWLDDPSDHDHRVAARLGLVPHRTLFEMRRSLPHPERSNVVTRDFVPGVDDAAWLDVNNRAFASHGEQGGWSNEMLQLRLAEPWFDPAGFRVFDDDGRLVAFCWTKLHDDVDPAVGEIYVIAVDPGAHGRGLGRELTLAGLDSIADRGVSIANLYVDAANRAAVGLYRRLGFHVHRRRIAFGPAGASTRAAG